MSLDEESEADAGLLTRPMNEAPARSGPAAQRESLELARLNLLRLAKFTADDEW